MAIHYLNYGKHQQPTLIIPRIRTRSIPVFIFETWNAYSDWVHECGAAPSLPMRRWALEGEFSITERVTLTDKSAYNGNGVVLYAKRYMEADQQHPDGFTYRVWAIQQQNEVGWPYQFEVKG